MMQLPEWNRLQVQKAMREAYTLNSRVDYFDATGNLFPTASELALFYIEKHAPEFQQEHQEEQEFG